VSGLVQLGQAALSEFPAAAIASLDTVWFQVAGTLCNLECTHCFLSCSPSNHAFGMMSLADVEPYLVEAESLGVKEYYFTGGEPFMNKELLPILETTLSRGPATVLSNGISIRRVEAERLAVLAEASEYSLDLRISLDGADAESNDAIRGAGSFDRALSGIQELARAGINPVVTVTGAFDGATTRQGRSSLLEFLRSIGLRQPRLKVMPLLRIGAEEKRKGAYSSEASLRGRALSKDDLDALQCSSSRMVTDRGVYVCPILLDFPGARMGRTLSETLSPFRLAYAACTTCHEEGLSCRT
jgi:molybdenum cofactor biosynthesis enzyme MoaA